MKMKTLTIKISFIILFSIFSSSILTFAQTLFWQQISDDYYVYDLLYDGEQYLYFSGSGSGSNKYFLRSSDLGATWEIVGNGLDGNGIYRLAIDSSGILWGGVAYGTRGIYKSSDSGSNWIRVLSSNDNIYSITVSPNNWIWAGTDEGKVIYSSDSGNTWVSYSIDNEGIWAIASNSVNQVFAGSMGGRIYRTTNLGTNWELVYNVPPLGIWGMVIDDSSHIYANKWNVRLISTDNGNSWTSITGLQLERLFLDNYHNFYAGLGYRSLDNFVSWSFIGPSGSFWVSAFAFVDSLIFAATTNGVFLHDPSYQPYVGKNYFPLELGNKWQFNRRCNNHFAGNTMYYVERDTLISNKRYFLLQGAINDWVRYDDEENVFYLRWNESDYVVMDYTLNEGSTFQHILFNSHEIKSANIVEPIFLSIFDSSYYSKGNWWPENNSSYTTYYSENLGETTEEYYYSGPGNTGGFCIQKMIRAIIKDSTGINYYSDNVKPTINFQPLFITNQFIMDWEFTVDHYYSNFDESWDVNFIDSVLLFSYYSNGDTTLFNNTISALNEPSSINYSISFLLDSTLMKNDYKFYYKIYAVDKGIVPEYSSKPDTGYYELIYDPNPVSVEINNVAITEYSLKQNYPNPFNPTTMIEYAVKKEGIVELIVYDVLGNVVKKLVDERDSPGNYSIEFDATELSSGIYFYHLKVNEFLETKKMVLLK